MGSYRYPLSNNKCTTEGANYQPNTPLFQIGGNSSFLRQHKSPDIYLIHFFRKASVRLTEPLPCGGTDKPVLQLQAICIYFFKNSFHPLHLIFKIFLYKSALLHYDYLRQENKYAEFSSSLYFL